MLTVRTLESMCTAENFNLFWQKVEKMRFQQELDVDEPQLPRRKKAPRHFEVPENVEGNFKAMCKHCQTLISGSTKATSNFLYHLKE